MTELDRRIAVEIMGIKEPRPPLVFRPPPYSTSYEYAMEAVDKWLEEYRRQHPLFPHGHMVAVDSLEMTYLPYEKLPYRVRLAGHRLHGPTLPEAICALLLALAKEEKS